MRHDPEITEMLQREIGIKKRYVIHTRFMFGFKKGRKLEIAGKDKRDAALKAMGINLTDDNRRYYFPELYPAEIVVKVTNNV